MEKMPDWKNGCKSERTSWGITASPYEIGKLLRLALGSIVFIRIPVWPYTIANLLIGAAFLWLRFDRYGKDARLEERV